ncbi:MAG: beta-Ala-His dipeptidase [Planctomycetes bacterium]|nr:beta-Ala-His dipeptidase [Planctomycetota bacterium]MBI3833572.1 beta-Ala-His dipeptidase [Planctomycetota bacterium]
MTPKSGKSLVDLEPKVVWQFFAEIASVPRPSKQEQRIRKHVIELARRSGLTAKEDATGNLVVPVKATAGHEKAPITVLQAHLDMVCEKNSGTMHDFHNEGIKTLIETEGSTGEQIVRADGTTLGADNGIGVALALAAATSSDVVHGPLELLFTIDEEDGMTGAKSLAPKSFDGRRMINLDSEEDDALYIGCAGGCDVNLSWTFDASVPPSGTETCIVSIGGLRGGHSGGDIHEGRANAIKILSRTLLRADKPVQLVRINGGSKRNAIPREAEALVVGASGIAVALQKAAAEVAAEGKIESFEPQVLIRAERTNLETGQRAIGSADTARVLAALMAIPSGVIGMHPKITGLVETSNNLSTISTSTDATRCTIQVGLLARSSSASRIRETVEQLESIGRMCVAQTSRNNAYPGWSPNPDSPLLGVCRRVYQQTLKSEPRVAAIHAGLECGIIGDLVGGMDMVSLGPTIRGAHSPDERVYVASVERTWRYLKGLLSELAKA